MIPYHVVFEDFNHIKGPRKFFSSSRYQHKLFNMNQQLNLLLYNENKSKRMLIIV